MRRRTLATEIPTGQVGFGRGRHAARGGRLANVPDDDPLRSLGGVLQRAGRLAARTAEWGASTLRLAGLGWGGLVAVVGAIAGRWWLGLLIGLALASFGWAPSRTLSRWARDVRADTDDGAVALRARIEAAPVGLADGVGAATAMISRRLKGRGRLRSLLGLRKLATELPDTFDDLDDSLGAFTPTRLAGLVPRLSAAAWSALSLLVLIVAAPLVLAIALAVS